MSGVGEKAACCELEGLAYLAPLPGSPVLLSEREVPLIGSPPQRLRQVALPVVTDLRLHINMLPQRCTMADLR